MISTLLVANAVVYFTVGALHHWRKNYDIASFFYLAAAVFALLSIVA